MNEHNREAIALTAHWTAAVRALESARPDRLFDDPWAALLAGPEGEAWLQGLPDQLRQGTAIFQPIRTRFFDDLLLRATAQEQICQVVLLAAGLDTRAFRLSWPAGARLFELDQPGLLDYKARLLSAAGAIAACERNTIGVDLAAGSWPEALYAAGFAPEERAVWLLEGFLFYLEEADVLQVLDQVSALAAPGSWLGLDVTNRAMLTSAWRRDWLESLRRAGIPQRSAMDEPEAVLGARGWQVTVVQPGEDAANYGRWPYPVAPRAAAEIPHSFLVTAQRRGPSSGLPAPRQP